MGTILTGALVVVVLAAILLCGIRKRRKGGSCGGCPCSCSCGGSCSGTKPGKNSVSNETPRR